MKILVTGGSGMLGSDLVAELERRGHLVAAPTSKELDITDPELVAAVAMSRGAHDWCINCAAYTAVDKAETEVQQATELNAIAPGYLSQACSMAGIKLMHISTDFVFDGNGTTPYKPDAPTRPLGVYGRTKREGEEAVLAANANGIVVRTSWLYGPNGRSFPKTMITAWEAGKQLRVVDDQTGCPTYTGDLARVLVDMVERNAYPGIYHACGPDVLTWYQFAITAIEVYKAARGLDRPIEITPIPTEAYPTPAARPTYSVLDTAGLYALGIEPMQSLSLALPDFMKRLTGGD